MSSPATIPLRANQAGEAVTLLVHGTYANDASSQGDRWWQSGSEFCSRLQALLPRGVRLARDGEVFHWSGDNSERARNKAAADLLDVLEEHERAGREYHLVGHSHGGSVIWHALKLATHSKRGLPGLKSWTTVGTPFLQHRSRAALSLSNILAVLLTVFLLRPAWLYATLFYAKIRQALIGGMPELVLPPDSAIGVQAILRAPLIGLVELLGVPVDRAPDGIRFGSYEPLGDVPFADYLFGSYEGLVLLGVTALAAYLYSMLALVSFVPALESHRIRSEYRLEKRAYKRFGARWLGIWSRDDEAINGLRATIDLTLSFVGAMMPRERVFVSDTPSLLYRPIVCVVAPVYNRIIRPLIDAYVRGIVVRAAQGNDRPTAMLVDVTPTPVVCSHGDFKPLPAQFNDKLLGYSDERARDIAPKLRRILGQPSFSLAMESFAGELSGQELVHTAYFDHEEIAALVARNIAFGERGFEAAEEARLPLTLLTWFVRSKEESLQNCDAPTWAAADLPSEPRRMAA